MSCEFYGSKSHRGDLIFFCTLTERPCFVEQPATAAGHELQLACMRRSWALETSPDRAQGPDPRQGLPSGSPPA